MIDRTAMSVAARRANVTTDSTLSEVFETLRLLADSIDFLNEDSDGWRICGRLSKLIDDRTQAKSALQLSMFKLLSLELKTYCIRSKISDMLLNILVWFPQLEAADLLLAIGGKEMIDEPYYNTDGYTLLHFVVVENCDKKGISRVLEKCPDLHPVGLDDDCTPQKESPTTLAMYSSFAFLNWLTALDNIEVDPERFIQQELFRNPDLHIGWTKDTLLDLWEYASETGAAVLPDCVCYDGIFRDYSCSDCHKPFWFMAVQPFWRHQLERIKQGLNPDVPGDGDLEDGEQESAKAIKVSEATDTSQEPDIMGKAEFPNIHDFTSESESELEFVSMSGSTFVPDAHGYPATISIQSECLYTKDELVCIDCWLHYVQHGHRRLGHWKHNPECLICSDEHPPPEDESSEDEFSPYLIHS